MARERVLVVDDEPGVRSALEPILADEGFEVTTVSSGEAALDALADREFDAVLLDVWLPGIDGLETLRRLRERNDDVEVVMISGHGTIDTAVKATKFGAFDFIEKPLSLERTLLVMRNALRQRRLRQSNRQLLEQLGRDTEIVGRSERTEALRGLVEIAAGSDAPVLICGEQGSGRENVARRIHARGRRRAAAFVEVPCGALDAERAASALGLDASDGGRVALARNGTLFLEDVDRLAPELQRRAAATLLTRTREGTDIRVLASAPTDAAGVHDELTGLVDVIRIDVPRLRDRREDIAMLVERFMHDLTREYGKGPKRLTAESLAALRANDWPGNVRQLFNLIERLVLVVPGERVTVDDLPLEFGGAGHPVEDLYGDFESLERGLRVFEGYQLRRAIARSSGDVEQAAVALGLERKELERRLRRMARDPEGS
ncbi:MAG TPA: sigma-54 dependent transcriptional regulator [Candidatus Polarisedimenticolaceae bacterium]|nr:sigma-54 dependent transcriptional regulator [Candidatus Polarisedimenticolaceae bacterium]